MARPRYAEGGALYHLYAIMVECDDHYLSYIRPEMEGGVAEADERFNVVELMSIMFSREHFLR